MQLNRIKAVLGYKAPRRIAGRPSAVIPNRVQRQFTIVRANNLVPSTSRRGNCWDNAVTESFFSSLKKERIRKRIYKTRDLAWADIFDYIEVFYNRARLHSHLGGVSPEAFEQASS